MVAGASRSNTPDLLSVACLSCRGIESGIWIRENCSSAVKKNRKLKLSVNGWQAQDEKDLMELERGWWFEDVQMIFYGIVDRIELVIFGVLWLLEFSRAIIEIREQWSE